MTTPDDRTLDNADVENDPDLGGRRDPSTATTTDDRQLADERPLSEERHLADERLVAEDAALDYRTRWEVVQQGFVDDPRNAVSEADKLVDEVLEHLAAGFDRQRRDLEQEWSDGEPSTEDLRSALQRYRAFFRRLLTL